MAKKGNELDGKDRRLLAEITTGMSYDSRVFNQRLRQQIERLTKSGLDEQSIIRVLEQDFNTNGRIFGEFRNSIKRGIVGGINQAFRRAGEVGEKLRWVTVSKNPCSDCVSISGEVDSYDNWVARGLPGSGWSLCRENCYCQIIPESVEIEESILI
jgi:hypothetical protein